MRRVRRKGGNKEKVFGCDLLEHLNASSQDIPLVLRCCSEFVETHGIVDGIYRLSGVSSNIQKLRAEFESDGTPDLNKDVYLQDIHCVSSLCKAYFRELPNPLLTYQLYEKFAEAVAIQLEEERLVKIRDVLKELPSPHYRTLEFLMRHLVKMASYSSETNMHARNLAIVWAPNLLRSKDIEVSGFNGTAVFKEVRVQSIVVEFILTHVPQLFPESGESCQRRKSLPSPSATYNQEEGFFKSAPSQAVPSIGNISPGDGPLPIRPYHAIIEGTEKRKGSLKGRKWMSIFNIGGRFHDPLRRHKHSAKEKDRPALRPARSMDSLSTPAYPNEGSRRTGQRPPSNKTPMSPVVNPSSQPVTDSNIFTGAIGGSEYAVTYRRGTGLVSGAAGMQGTYTALDPEGLGAIDHETFQSRSPGHSTKVSRRAAMHITGPTMVTVPLHITSNLALGVLQRGGGNRVIHCGRDQDGGDRVEGKDGGEEVEKRMEDRRSVEEEEKNHRGVAMDVNAKENTVAAGGSEGEGEGNEEEMEGVREQCRLKPELVLRRVSREQGVKSLTSNNEEQNYDDAVTDNKDADEYMDMKGVSPADFQPVVVEHRDSYALDASDILNLTEVEGDDLGLSGYVQDNFEFLDQMDCSVLDHMDCTGSYQVHEFSVEPPGHSDDEYEMMEQEQPSCHPTEVQTCLQACPTAQSQAGLKPHRLLGINTESRHTKSLSLPYMTSPIHGPEKSGSEDEVEGYESDDENDDDYSSEDDENMFIKSLPADMFLKDLSRFEPDSERQEISAPENVPVHESQSFEELNVEFPAFKESTDGDQKLIETNDKDEKDRLEENVLTKMEEEAKAHQRNGHAENNTQSKETEENHSVMEDPQSDSDRHRNSEASTHCCTNYPLLGSDGSSAMADITVNEEKEEADYFHGDYRISGVTQEKTAEVSFEGQRDFSESATEQLGRKDEGEGRDGYKDLEDLNQKINLAVAEDDERMWEVIGDKKPEEKREDGSKEHDRTSSDIWDDHENVEITEKEESKQSEVKGARESVAEEENLIDCLKVEVEEGQTTKVEVDDGGVETSKADRKFTDAEIMQENEEKEATLTKTENLDEAIQGKHAIGDKTQSQARREEVSTENDKERDDGPQRKLPSIDLVRESDTRLREVGRKLVISKHPKILQVRAVPVVPPKPQHCRITALSLRQQQQQQQRETQDSVREGETSMEQDALCGGEHGKDGDQGREEKEKPKLRGREKERERDTNRNSPLSMCFDEAVAIATMRREKEKECEKERQREWGNEVQ